MALEAVNASSSAKLPFKHTMLLYSSEEDNAAAKYVNEGLRRGCLTVYVPINTYDSSHLSKIVSEIINYKDNVNRGNLLTLDIRSFYNFVFPANTKL